jgi:hypothetical protein
MKHLSSAGKYSYRRHFPNPDPGPPGPGYYFHLSGEGSGDAMAPFVGLRPPAVPDLERKISTGFVMRYSVTDRIFHENIILDTIKINEHMKKPILTNDQRKRIVSERAKFQIALMKFKREFGKTGLGKLMQESVKAIARIMESISGRWILFLSIMLAIVALVVIFYIKVFSGLPVLFFVVVPIACHFIWVIYKTIFKQH